MTMQHLQALLVLELRRMTPTVLRIQAAALVLAVLFIATSSDPLENVLAVLVGTPLGATLLAGMTVVRDKMEGTLEFLCSLPATAAELAAARFAAAALSILPGVTLAGIGLAIADLPAPFDVLRGATLVGAVLGFWLLLTVVSWVVLAAFASFEFARLLRWPLAILAFVLIVLPRVLERVLPTDLAAAVRQFVVQPWAPTAVALLMLGLSGACAWLAFGITRRAFANYRPDFDQPM